ncbi:MAG TPA: hypothetical protein VFJ43_03370 [Bacteroidia bacterium]|nr:hypothetical protein [Bacteroidia bacterium]
MSKIKNSIPEVKSLITLFLISMLALACNNSSENSGNDSIPKTDSSKVKTDSVPAKTDSTHFIGSHLRDTAFVSGNEIIFLRPDSLRFLSYEKKLKSGIDEADADFGDAVSMTIDTILGNKNFKSVKAMVSTKRYIQLMDCKGEPITIDRDTVNFGVILTGMGKKIEAEQNVYPGQHYIKVLRNYFNLKK